jgi:hypothetical protein
MIEPPVNRVLFLGFPSEPGQRHTGKKRRTADFREYPVHNTGLSIKQQQLKIFRADPREKTPAFRTIKTLFVREPSGRDVLLPEKFQTSARNFRNVMKIRFLLSGIVHTFGSKTFYSTTVR